MKAGLFSRRVGARRFLILAQPISGPKSLRYRSWKLLGKP